MGEGYEVSADAEKLDGVRGRLNQQRELVEGVNLTAPSGSMFGLSPKGRWLEDVVNRGHKNIGRSLKETAQGLEKTSDGIHDAMVEIEGADVDAQIAMNKIADALAIMSNPLVIFGKKNLPF
ncbi:hypothetical protein ABTZ46_17940 [Nocardioides sp. NPDC126508]